METMPSWCGQDTLPANIGKTLEDGQRIVSVSLVETYAFFHPVNGGEKLASWVAAEQWFKEQGCTIVSNEEYDSYRFRVFEVPGSVKTLYFIKLFIK